MAGGAYGFRHAGLVGIALVLIVACIARQAGVRALRELAGLFGVASRAFFGEQSSAE